MELDGNLLVQRDSNLHGDHRNRTNRLQRRSPVRSICVITMKSRVLGWVRIARSGGGRVSRFVR